MKDSESISPETGNLDNVAFYADKLDDFYNRYYGGGENNPRAAYLADAESRLYTKEFGGNNDGEVSSMAGYDKRASTYFPLPQLEEVLIEPPQYGVTSEGVSYTNLRMVKTKFGFFNVPGGIGGTYGARGRGQDGSEPAEYPPSWKPTIKIQPSLTNIGKTIGGIEITDSNLFELLLPTQVSSTNLASTTISYGYADSARGAKNDQAVPFYDTSNPQQPAIWLADSSWTDAKAVQEDPSRQNRAATTSALMVPVWLFSDAIYEITFGFVGYGYKGESSTLDSYNKYGDIVPHMLAASPSTTEWMWHTNVLEIQIPNAASENRTALALTEFDGVDTNEGSTTRFNEYYLDCTNLDKDGGTVVGEVVGTAGAGYQYYASPTTFEGSAVIYAKNNMTSLSGDQAEVNMRWGDDLGDSGGRFIGTWGFTEQILRGLVPDYYETYDYGDDWFNVFTSNDKNDGDLLNRAELAWTYLTNSAYQELKS